MPATLIVGDLHGCSAELTALLELARPTRVVLVGDLFAKGPDPLGCWRIIRDGGFEAVLGNHDARMLQVWDEAVAGRGPSTHHQAVRQLRGDPEIRAWLQGLPLVIEGGTWIVVHGGLNPEEGVAGTGRVMALSLRRWPDDQLDDNPFWWQVWPECAGRTDPRTVVYGHDAVRSLQDHRPATLGLDSGCVYGGCLSGWIPEQKRLLQVAAKKVWIEPIGRRWEL